MYIRFPAGAASGRILVITNIVIAKPSRKDITLPTVKDSPDGLGKLAGSGFHKLLTAALKGTNLAYRQDDRPSIDLILPSLTPYNMGALMQMLMIATVIEGDLLGVNPFGQPGVEAYKKFTKKNLGL